MLEKDLAPVDQDLVDLPGPPRADRTWTLAALGLAAIACIVVAALVRHDAAYAFQSAVPTPIGELTNVGGESLSPNQYIVGSVRGSAVHAVRFERPFAEDSYRISQVLGRPDIWVETRIPPRIEGSRFEPAIEVRGRLIPFNALGLRHRGINNAIERGLGERVSDQTWLVVDAETPAGARASVALFALCIVLCAACVGTIAKMMRRIKD